MHEEIEANANKEEFIIDEPPAIEEKPDPKTVADVTAGAKEKEPVKAQKEKEEYEYPPFMKEEL